MHHALRVLHSSRPAGPTTHEGHKGGHSPGDQSLSWQDAGDQHTQSKLALAGLSRSFEKGRRQSTSPRSPCVWFIHRSTLMFADAGTMVLHRSLSSLQVP